VARRKWEYCSVRRIVTDTGDSLIRRYYWGDPSGKEESVSELLTEVARLGEEGWELVTANVVPSRNGLDVKSEELILKRPKD
jgi:hypothetical protein